MSSVTPVESCSHPLAIIRRVLLGLLLCLPLMAQAWWSTEWSYRKNIALDGAETPALGGPVASTFICKQIGLWPALISADASFAIEHRHAVMS